MANADERHRLAQTRLSENVRARLAALILALPNPTEQAAMDAYVRAAVPIVGGGQRLAATLALSYMRDVTAARAGSVARATEGVLVTAESPVARSPILRVWGALADGVALAEALDMGGSYAGALASGDLQIAERSGLTEGARASGREITGWRKQLSFSACKWCRKVGAERVYNSAETVPFHDRDHCGVAPILAEETETIATGYRVLRRSAVR